MFDPRSRRMPGLGAKAALLEPGRERRQVVPESAGQLRIGRAHRDLYFARALRQPDLHAPVPARHLQPDVSRRRNRRSGFGRWSRSAMRLRHGGCRLAAGGGSFDGLWRRRNYRVGRAGILPRMFRRFRLARCNRADPNGRNRKCGRDDRQLAAGRRGIGGSPRGGNRLDRREGGRFGRDRRVLWRRFERRKARAERENRRARVRRFRRRRGGHGSACFDGRFWRRSRRTFDHLYGIQGSA